MYNKQTITVGLITLLVGVGGGFYGGMKYVANQDAAAALARSSQRNGMMNGQGGQRTGGQPGDATGGGRGGMIVGQITAKDATSLTIKMPDGSSKIIFYSDSTTVGKATPGSAADLSTGVQIRANGKANPDGSIAAQNIQITPALTPGQ